jgi:RNA polymerase sigma-70 factor (ECF subfamily)
MDETLLVQEYRSRVLYFILRHLRDRAIAEELTQETLLIVIEALRKGRVREPSRIGSYIFGTAKNLIHEHRRSSRATDISSDRGAQAEAWIAHPEAELLLQEERAAVRRALEHLNDQDREIIYHSFTGTERLEEIADKLGSPYAAARKRKSRALERLRKMFVKLSQKRSS